MKKILTAIFFSVMVLNAAEFTGGHDSIQCGEKKMRFLKQGTTVLMHRSKGFLTGSLTVGTKGGYFTFGSAGANGKFTNPEKDFWEYSGSFPEDRKNTRMKVKLNFELTPHGSIESNLSWTISDPKNLKDTFYSVSVPMANFQGKSILLSGKEVPIANITKYGFFQANDLENPELVLYHWDKDRKISIQGEGKIRIVFQSVKDKNVMVRFYPQPAGGTMKLIWQLQ